MGEDGLVDAQRLARETIAALNAVVTSAGDAQLLALLTTCETTNRALDQLSVRAIAVLHQRGAFTDRGYRTPGAALGDLLGWERFEARRRVTAAEQVCGQVGLDGAPLPARLPATAEVFAAGQCSLRHVETITNALATPAAGRLTPEVWQGAEAELADKAPLYTPSELADYATALVTALDQDGAEPDDRDPEPVNELHLARNRGGGGGSIKGRFEDAAMFDAIAAVIDAKAKPADGDDDRPAPQRQAEALAEVCGFVLDHGELPDCGGARPHLNVLIRLEDLEDRARQAMLDFGGSLSPTTLRMLACDAAVIPIVMNGQGQPLDVGRINAPSPTGCVAPWPSGIAGARTPAAAVPLRGARCITCARGRRAARPRCATRVCQDVPMTTVTTTRRAALYCRISLDREGAGLGVARQEQDCRALAQRLGWAVTQVYVDNDVSAYSGRSRPAWDRLMADIRAGTVDAVIGWHVDRLTRSPRELEDVIDLADRHGLALATVTGDIDLGTPTGRMVARMLGAAARHESEHKGERQRRQIRQAAEAGKAAGGGHRPFGYAADRVTVIEPEVAVIRECAARVLAASR
jgi:5-methylcytosine-specific restriction protein A